MFGEVFVKLYEAYGEQNWWPAETRFEVMVGAILTQNTNWENVEKAIAALRENNALEAEAIAASKQEKIAGWIRPSGYYNQKAEYLKHFSGWYLGKGGYKGLAEIETGDLRQQLLALKGIGKETADSILLYAFARPVFVVDAYTRRLMHRLGLMTGYESYDELSHIIQISLDADVELFNEYHALIVRHAKTFCRKKPLCQGCPLQQMCLKTGVLA